MNLILIGYSGCGKSTIAKQLLEQYPNYFNQHLEVSDIIKKHSVLKTGEDVINNEQVMTELNSLVIDKCIVTGAREIYIVDKLLKKDDTICVRLDVSEPVRFDRLIGRGMSLDKIIQKDVIERRIGLSRLMFLYDKNTVNGEQSIQNIVNDIMYIIE